jgi:formamidopyrimidine-DNA glycosylase
MPELPEVEHGRRLLARHFEGKVITRAAGTPDDKVFASASLDEIVKRVRGKTIAGVRRVGKNIYFELSGGKGRSARPATLCFHQGMTGAYTVRGHESESIQYMDFSVKAGADGWPPRHTKIEIETADGSCFAYTNSRRFGRVRLLDFCSTPENPPLHLAPFSSLGPDALTSLPTLEAFGTRLSERAAAVKSVLLDQATLAGIGNWVADEILYQARVHPAVRANALTADQTTSLHRSIRYVLGTACGAAVDACADGFPQFWLFHARWTKKKASSDHRGRTITFEKVGGRTSAVVRSVQSKKGKALPPVFETEAPRADYERAIASVAVMAAEPETKPKRRRGGEKGMEEGEETTKKRKMKKRKETADAAKRAKPGLASFEFKKGTARGRLKKERGLASFAFRG